MKRDAGCYSLIIIVSATILLRSRYWMIALTSRGSVTGNWTWWWSGSATQGESRVCVEPVGRTVDLGSFGQEPVGRTVNLGSSGHKSGSTSSSPSATLLFPPSLPRRLPCGLLWATSQRLPKDFANPSQPSLYTVGPGLDIRNFSFFYLDPKQLSMDRVWYCGQYAKNRISKFPFDKKLWTFL